VIHEVRHERNVAGSIGENRAMHNASEAIPEDPVLSRYVAAAKDDADTLGVERLMTSRGVAHEWGNDLEPLKALAFDADDLA
jgi:hypothetical protein